MTDAEIGTGPGGRNGTARPRGRNHERPGRFGPRRFLAAAILTVLVGTAGVWLALRLQPIPAAWSEGAAEARVATVLRITDRLGNPIASMRGEENPFLPVRYGEIDPLLIQATLAAEDGRFFSHPGIDPLAIARAAGQNLRAGRIVSGGSTVTQQLIKLLEPKRAQRAADQEGAAGRRPGPGISKLQEAWLALAMETRWSKEQILEAYFNAASYGSDLRGVGAACRAYFGHGPDRLTLEEASLLAALPQSPVRLDPRRNPEAALVARNRVLERMDLPPAQRDRATEHTLGLVPAPASPAASIAPHWIAALNGLPAGVSEVRLPLDRSLQTSARKALREVLEDLRDLGADDGAVVVIHNASGQVRTWIGSPDWFHPGHGQFDAARALRQPGSALKPFAYALAFERGLGPSSLLPDLPLNHPGLGGTFRPRNYSGVHHGPVRARMALANSWNAPAVWLASWLGIDPLLGLFHELGLESLNRPASDYGLGLVLGVGEVSLLDLTTAYSCLARGGVHLPRVEILEGRSADGALLVGSDSNRAIRRVLDEAACFLVLSILSDPEARAPAFGRSELLDFPYPAAVKTGTSSDWRDNWAFGLTAEWTAGVWVGAADGEPMDQVSGTLGALRVLRRVLDSLMLPSRNSRDAMHGAEAIQTGAYAVEAVQSAAAGFPLPPGLEMRRICLLSGLPAGPDCPETALEWFRSGQSPGPVCDWHQRIPIDDATGLLARSCTPGDRLRSVLFACGGSTRGTGDGRPPLSPSGIFDSWIREQGWPAPPKEASPCLCGRPECRPLREPGRPALWDRPGLQPAKGTAGKPALAGRAPEFQSRCRILSPADGSVYILDPTLPRSQQALALEGTAAGDELVWLVNGEEFARVRPGSPAFWPLRPGSHRIALRGENEERSVRIRVEPAE